MSGTFERPATRAGDCIMSLVSGFPIAKARSRGMVMLQAYVDESGNGDPNLLVVAGYIATSSVWADFSNAWKHKLDEAGLSCFKIREMRLKTEIAGWFYRTLEDFDIRGSVACIINTRDLIEVEKGIKFPSNIKPLQTVNPYFWALKNIILMLAQNQSSLNIAEPVDFIFDDKSEKISIPRAWEIMERSFGRPDVLGSMPIFRKDHETMPLQAADLYAWWVLKWQRESVTDWCRSMPFPWGEKKRINRMISYFGKSSFLVEASMMLQQIARNDEELEYARSLYPTDFMPNYLVENF